MKTKILTVLAILLAIPTYGISLIIWLFAKYKYDKFSATRVLINAAVISYNNGGRNETRYAINNAALPMVFDCFGGRIITNLDTSVSGVIPHPRKDVILIVTMTQISNNQLLIKATPFQG